MNKCNYTGQFDMDKFWDKICAKFVTREDVLKIIQCIKDKECNIQGIQSGVDGPVVAAGFDGIAHLKFENWVESEVLDADKKKKKLYNESSNALTASAAATIVKAIREDIRHKTFNIQVIEDVDNEGHPIVPCIEQNTIYLTPEAIPTAN